MFQLIWREEVPIGPGHEALLMVGTEEPDRRLRARVWIGRVDQSEPLLYVRQTALTLEEGQLACRRMLRAGLVRLGLQPAAPA